jgi:hypothetical protein
MFQHVPRSFLVVNVCSQGKTLCSSCITSSLNVKKCFNPLNIELNPIYHFLALLGAHPILHVSGVRVNIINYVIFNSN